MDSDSRLDRLLEEVARHDRLESERIARRLRPDTRARPQPDRMLSSAWTAVPASARTARKRVTRGLGALAAALLIGLAIGRWSAGSRTPAPPVPPIAVEQLRAAAPMPLWLPVEEVRDRGTSLLVAVREGPTHTAEVEARARDLLWATRRLLDAPAAVDPEQLALLAELEWILVRLAELGPDADPGDVAATRASIQSRDLIGRLHRIEAGPGAGE